MQVNTIGLDITGFRHSPAPPLAPEPAGDRTDDGSLHVDRRPQLASLASPVSTRR